MLEIIDLQVVIGKKEILGEVNAQFEKGKIYGILGKNGAGKTTFFRTLFGFYPPRRGSISYKQRLLQKRQMSFLETENYLYPYMRGTEYLRLIKKDEHLIDKWNTLFALPLEQLAQDYSTGMKKKLAFMGVLLQDREILLLDEPFNGLDLESNEQLIPLLKKLKTDKIILISSHILSTLLDISDEILVLEAGHFSQKMTRPDFADFEQKLKKDIQNRIDFLTQPDSNHD